MPDFTAFLDKYFKASSIPEGTNVELTLRSVKLEEVGMDKESKPVAYFSEDPRGLVLSANKYTALAEANASRDCDTWAGSRVSLTVDPTIKFKGRVVGGVVLSVISPATKGKE
jgi:hypothetical protein